MLKKSLYLNITNFVLDKTKFWAFQLLVSPSKSKICLSYALNRLSLNNNLIKSLSSTLLKLPLQLSIFKDKKTFFKFLQNRGIVLVFYKNYFMLNETIRILLFSFFYTNLLIFLKFISNWYSLHYILKVTLDSFADNKFFLCS